MTSDTIALIFGWVMDGLAFSAIVYMTICTYQIRKRETTDRKKNQIKAELFIKHGRYKSF